MTDSFRNDGHQERKEGPLVFPDDAVQLVNKLPVGSAVTVFGQVRKG